MAIMINLNLEGVPHEFGWMPPVGPYRIKLTSAKLTENSSVGYEGEIVEGPNKGRSIFFYLRVPEMQEDARKAQLATTEWILFLKACGVPEDQLQGGTRQMDAENLLGTTLVVVRGTHVYEGKTRQDTYFPPPDQAEAAMAGNWMPPGGLERGEQSSSSGGSSTQGQGVVQLTQQQGQQQMQQSPGDVFGGQQPQQQPQQQQQAPQQQPQQQAPQQQAPQQAPQQPQQQPPQQGGPGIGNLFGG